MLSSGESQHFPRGGAHRAQRVVKRRDALAVAGKHPLVDRIAVRGVERCKVDTDLRERQIKLVRENGRERGRGALAHFRLRGEEGD